MKQLCDCCTVSHTLRLAGFIVVWFDDMLSGDTASYEEDAFRIQGRTSVDIIKSGGYKISALDIEYTLLCHDKVKDVAVLGVPDETYGEIIAAIVVPHDSGNFPAEAELAKYCVTKMASYQKPRKWKFVDVLPRNAMGKVNKKELLNTFFLNE